MTYDTQTFSIVVNSDTSKVLSQIWDRIMTPPDPATSINSNDIEMTTGPR